MIVLYLKEGNQFLQAIKGFPKVTEKDNKLYIGGNIALNDLTKAGYREYPDQKVNIPTEWNEELEDFVEVPVTLDELKLRDFTEADLAERAKQKRDLAAEIDELKSGADEVKAKLKQAGIM